MIIPKLDYVFFLEAPTEVRIERIRERESRRFGKRIQPGEIQHKNFENFLKWSEGYETGGVSRTRKIHEDWLTQNALEFKKISTQQLQLDIVKEILETLKLGQV
jgi:thymidylate kinase